MNNNVLLKYRWAYWGVIVLLFFALATSCNPIRKYPKGTYLLKKNHININKTNLDINEMRSLIKQKPTRTNFGLYINIRLWNFAVKGKETGFKKWLKNTIAAEPILLDTILTESSVRQLKYYLESHGYFNSLVEYVTKYKKWGARTDYLVNTKTPYTVRNINYLIPDATLKAFVYADKNNCKIVSGENYNVDKMDGERDRITRNLQNNGYFYFSKSYISFLVDSSLNSHQIDISIKISDAMGPSKKNPDSLVTVKHKRFTINKIIVNTDFERDRPANTHYDTIRAIIPNRVKTRPHKVYYFCYPNKLKINLRTLAQTIYIDSNDVYNYNDVDMTYKSLLDLKIYRYVNIEFQSLPDTSTVEGKMDCYIKLSKSPTQALAVSTDATHTGGELGVQASLIYTNKNIFHGAEIYDIKFNGAVDFQSFKKNTGVIKPVIPNLSFIHTIETGLELNIKIPRFLMPVRQYRFPKYFKPKTNINASFNYQIRPEYERYYAIGSLVISGKKINTRHIT